MLKRRRDKFGRHIKAEDVWQEILRCRMEYFAEKLERDNLRQRKLAQRLIEKGVIK